MMPPDSPQGRFTIRPGSIAIAALVLAPLSGFVPVGLGAGSSTAPKAPTPAAAAANPSGAPSGRVSLTGRRVHVYNLAGRLEVLPGTGSSVQIEIEYGGRDANKLDVQTPAGNGEPALIIRYPEDRIIYSELPRGMRTSLRVGPDGRFGDDSWKSRLEEVEIRSSGEGLEAWADLKVRVPKGQKIALHLGVGEASLTNVDGEIFVDCAAAGVTASGMRGRFTVDTGSGTVQVSDVEGLLSVDTGSGSVDITQVKGPSVVVDTGSGSVSLSKVTAEELSVDTGSGSVELSELSAPVVHVDTGSGWVKMGLLTTVEEVYVDTGSGSVEITAPANLSATVSLETGSGDLESDFPLRILRKDSDSISGTIGDGKGKIAVETGSGSVLIRRR
ncbi:MAG: DUF4097 family beta strand repeat-containing protein [Candidatus Eiseniibacteriota bacterium]